jgi:hypothetical protein
MPVGTGLPEPSLAPEFVMDARVRPTVPARVIGREEMEALVSSVLGALERAGLTDMVAELQHRVLDRRPEDLSDAVETGNSVLYLSYKPIIELLLHEVRDVSRMPHLSAQHRRDRITWAITAAGM